MTKNMFRNDIGFFNIPQSDHITASFMETNNKVLLIL